MKWFDDMAGNIWRGDLPDWVESQHESRPNTEHGRKFRMWSRRTAARDLAVVAWLGIVLLAAMLAR
jgi:hypothetical protein